MDVADIDGNKKAEIYVTCHNNRGRIISFTAKWNGTGIEKITDKERWYFRVMNSPGRGNVLLGQKRGMPGAGTGFEIDPAANLFLPKIHELEWQNGQLESVRLRVSPRRANIFGYASGDILNDGREITAFSKRNGKIAFMDEKGDILWESAERYGGTTRYLEYPEKDSSKPGRLYLPQRILVSGSNGKNDIVLVKNHDRTSGLMSKIKSYTFGRLECLEWDGATMKQKWVSPEISGYISDFIIGDIDNDGRMEIVCAVVVKTGGMLGKKKSCLIAREL